MKDESEKNTRTSAKHFMKNLIIISAPSGSGKTTICKQIQQKIPVLNFPYHIPQD